MALKARSTTRLAFSRLVSVSLCLCAFAVVPYPQFAVLTYAAPAEAESPSQEDPESSKKQLVVCRSARRNLNHRRDSHLGRSHDTGDPLHQIASYAGHLPAIVGHQLANGLRAPLLN